MRFDGLGPTPAQPLYLFAGTTELPEAPNDCTRLLTGFFRYFCSKTAVNRGVLKLGKLPKVWRMPLNSARKTPAALPRPVYKMAGEQQITWPLAQVVKQRHFAGLRIGGKRGL
jgi:hypothetical protein